MAENTLDIEQVKITDLKADPKNARKHNAKNLEAIAASLKQFGQRKPIVLSADNTVVAGNGTVEAAKKLGLKDLAAVRVPQSWTPEMIRAFAIADNRTGELSEFDKFTLVEQLVELREADFELEALGFSDTEFKEITRFTAASVIGSTDAFKEWVMMPEYEQPEKQSAYHTTVHFVTEQDADAFFQLIGISKGKSVWWPKSDGLIGSNINIAYVVDNDQS